MDTLKYEILPFQEALIIICRIPQSLDNIKQNIQISEDYLLGMKKLGTEKRQKEFLTARLAINKLLGKEIQISYDNAGKPILQNHEGHISISHSRDFLALIYHPEKAVGIDIECPTNKVLKVYKRYLNETEQKYLFPNLLKLQLAWSVKEALFKMNGEAFVNFATSMQIRNFDLSDKGTIFCEQPSTQNVYQLYYEAHADYNLVYSIAP